MVNKHITDKLPYRLSRVAGGSYNTDSYGYDVAINNQPYFLANNTDRPYRRVTAKYRKDQVDQTTEPGEQTLTGWWLRSQTSFHYGAGIAYYEPSQDETVRYRFDTSKGVNVWTPGQATLLREVNQGHQTTGNIASNGVTQQQLRAIQWGSTYNGALMLDEYDVDKIFPTITAVVTNKALTSNVATITTSPAHNFTVGMQVTVAGVDATFNGEYRITTVPSSTTFTYAKTASDVPSTAVSPTGTASSNVIHFLDYNSGTDFPVYAICDDGATAFFITNDDASGSDKATVFKKALSLDSTTAPTKMFDGNFTISNAVMEYTKNRVVLAADNKVYEFAPTYSGVSFPTALYENPSATHVYTSITSSGPAIYLAGYNKLQSTIEKFVLTTAGAMPTLSSAITAAEMPIGEVVHAIHYYLGYMLIGTNKGIRVAQVTDDGSLIYGPLIVETSQPVYAFTTRDRFAWAASSVDGEPGTIRIDLSVQISPLRFAYANDVYKPDVSGKTTTAVSFIGNTDQVAFTTAAGYVYMEDDANLVSTGFLQIGRVRYNTLEPKVYKFLWPRVDLTNGSMTIDSIDPKDVSVLIRTSPQGETVAEGAVTYPTSSVEHIGLKFNFNRSSDDNTLGPVFDGWQLKSLPATKRTRLIQYPVFNYDNEEDKFNNKIGYEGRAYQRLKELEGIEELGDTVQVVDYRTGESFTATIEELDFVNTVPPDERFENFGGILLITVRTV